MSYNSGVLGDITQLTYLPFTSRTVAQRLLFYLPAATFMLVKFPYHTLVKAP